MIVVTVGALAGFVQRRTALAAEFDYGCALRDLGLRVLRLCCLRPKLLAQVAHVGGHENAVLLFVSVLAAELIVDGDYVFQQQDCHHQQFIHQSDHNGSEDHDQDAVDAQPVALRVTLMICGFGLRVKRALRSIVHRYPTSGFRRPFHGIANAFHSIPFCEAGRRLPAFYHRFDKLVGFDGFQFAVPNVHSGNVPGHFPVKMRGAGVDCLKAPSVVGVAGQTHLQLVESLVVEVEAAQSAGEALP